MSGLSAFSFAPDEVSKFEDALRPADRILGDLAARYRLRLLPHSSKGWPGRTLRGRKMLKTYALRISLDPSYIDNDIVRWDIHDVWMYDYGELFRRTIRFRELAKQMDFEKFDVQRILERAVRENFG